MEIREVPFISIGGVYEQNDVEAVKWMMAAVTEEGGTFFPLLEENDFQNAFAEHEGGALIAYGDGHPWVQFVSVRAPQAYPQIREYRRSLALVKVSAYLVDLFEVKGGAQHDWLLHGDADRDSALASELEMEDLEGALFASGETFRMWDSEAGFKGGPGVRHPDNIKHALGMVRQVRNTQTDDAWTATFRPSPDDGTALRLWMMGEQGTEVFFGEMPSVRRAGDRNAELLDYWMPLVMARHKGEDLESNFLAVHEP